VKVSVGNVLTDVDTSVTVIVDVGLSDVVVVVVVVVLVGTTTVVTAQTFTLVVVTRFVTVVVWVTAHKGLSPPPWVEQAVTVLVVLQLKTHVLVVVCNVCGL